SVTHEGVERERRALAVTGVCRAGQREGDQGQTKDAVQVHVRILVPRPRSNKPVASGQVVSRCNMGVICSGCMVSTATRAPLSAHDYLEFESAAEVKHELWQGEVFAMAGASYTHNRIVANLLAGLRDALAGGPCVPLPSDMKVHVPSRGGFVYPDASVGRG